MTKTWSVVLLNKKYIYRYLKCIVYDKLLKPRQSFRITLYEGKDKAVPLQAWSGPEGSRKLRFPDYMTTAQDGGRLSALRTGCYLPPGNCPGTHLC